jgi:beta-lactam-binding protein with PASTA domain
MWRKNPRVVLGFSLNLVASLLALVATQLFVPSTGAQQPTVAPTEPAPIAVIKTILVGSEERLAADVGIATLTRSGKNLTTQTGALLYAGDELTTGPTARLTLLLLDNPAEKDNEVLLATDTHVQLGSVFTWLGRALLRVRGKFETSTSRQTLGVRGTEFEVEVLSDGTNKVKVLEGGVTVTKGAFAPPQSGGISKLKFEPRQVLDFLNASYTTQQAMAQNQMDFVATAGKSTTIERDFVFSNTCEHKHSFQIRGPRNLGWFQLLGGDQFEIDSRSTKTIRFGIKLDATRVPAGVHEGEIIARCLDCTQESTCSLGGLLLNVTIRVTPSNGSDSAPPPVPPVQPPVQTPEQPQQQLPEVSSAVATKLQEITLTPSGTLIKSDGAAEIKQTLEWSDEVLVAGHPTYSAQAVVPHFQSSTERDQQFRDARHSSVLKNDPQGYKTLAAVYVDWGNGAKAIDSLKNAIVMQGEDQENLTDLGEAYRQAGKLPEASDMLVKIVRLYPDFLRARVAQGNVYLDQSRVARERKEYLSANHYLELARQAYAHVTDATVPGSSTTDLPPPTLKATPPQLENSHGRGPQRRRTSTAISSNLQQTVAQSNLGEVYLALGEIAKEQGQLGEAQTKYAAAEQRFKRAEGAETYPFATKGLGDVYREVTEVSKIQGDSARASQAFQQSQNKYAQAINSHKDFAAAYVGLGNLFEDAGKKDQALNAYVQATRVRPEESPGYYHVSVLVSETNKRLAAAYARTYLNLERPAFKEGEQAENARLVSAELPPKPQQELMTHERKEDQKAVNRQDTVAAKVKVPGMKGDSQKDALKKLARKGLESRVEEKPECNATGKVLYSSPARDSEVDVGSLVTIYVSTSGPNAVPVPNVTGLLRSRAEDELIRAGLRASIRGTSPTNSRAPDTVVSQKPDDRKTLMAGCEVALTLAVPVPPVEVPTYIGLSRSQALDRLSPYFGKLLRGDVIEVDGYDVGDQVVNQDPKPGQLVDEGTRVTLYISRAVPVVPDYNKVVNRVPDFRGMKQQAAIDAINNSNGRFKLGKITYKYQAPSGYVIEQTPLPGSNVPFGQIIDLVVSDQGGD